MKRTDANIALVIVLVIIQIILLVTSLSSNLNDSLWLSFTYFFQLAFLFPLYMLINEENKVTTIILPIIIGIWLLLLNGFGWFAHCVGGCSSNFVMSAFPIASLLLSLFVLVYAFKKNIYIYSIIIILLIFQLIIFTPFMSNSSSYWPFFR